MASRDLAAFFHSLDIRASELESEYLNERAITRAMSNPIKKSRKSLNHKSDLIGKPDGELFDLTDGSTTPLVSGRYRRLEENK